MSTAGYLVSRVGDSVYIRALGMANMANAPTLDAFLNEELASGLRFACVDLSECMGMDSTFMGTLVGFHHRMAGEGGRFLVVNPSPANRRLLDMLGVSEVLPVLNNHSVPDLQFITLGVGDPKTATERALHMKKAHESLIALSESNRSKFSPFLAALETDLARRQAEQGDEP